MSWFARRPGVVFWPLLRVAQAAVALQAVLGMVLLAGGRRPADDLHLAYGIAALLVNVVAEGMRAGVAQRHLAELPEQVEFDQLPEERQLEIAEQIARGELGVMTIASLLVLTLALRAWQTGG
ncbi:hypothetical protein [Thermoleophilum album]|uniref:Uncharacterized protein n=1 Tax=Thermoleophilum album TaxID=29539 RepID=A0A1H6FID3_THEAL|nr:hypothetical protein [Thermoleophilum album]SEH10596.1 hypothetical protein SAMN02745716_0466 [Thermoleophilum album]